MAVKISEEWQLLMRELRYEPTTKHIRAFLGGQLVLESRRAILVWEPRRMVPCYAVPADGVEGVLSPGEPAGPAPDTLLHPGIPFKRHSTQGTVLDVSAGGLTAQQAAFRFDDSELEDYISFDPGAFDWMEEDDPVQAHPRDPFHRVDIRHSGRHIRVTNNGVVLAESTSPLVVFETHMPERIYLPPADIDWGQLIATDTTTLCPYKGEASYWRLAGGSGDDVAWSYQNPLSLAGEMASYVCFYDNLVDVEEL